MAHKNIGRKTNFYTEILFILKKTRNFKRDELEQELKHKTSKDGMKQELMSEAAIRVVL